VRTIGDGEKTLRHPEVGAMRLSHEGLTLNRAQGRRLIVYMAPPGSPDHDAMPLLDLAASGLSPRRDEPGRSGADRAGRPAGGGGQSGAPSPWPP
jgi:MmyB-like transcription regulator ligand binding domain